MASCGALATGLRWANVTSDAGGFRMAVRADADLVSHEILNRGYWEIQSPAQLARKAGIDLPPPPATFLDVGANLGYYTLLFASVGYDVIAVEPMLLNRRAIQASLCANPAFAPRVHLKSLALGSSSVPRNTRCVVRADDRNAGNGKLSCSVGEHCAKPPSASWFGRRAAASSSHASICEPVTMSTLDELLARERLGLLLRSPLVAVKIDVEGFECHVLEGGQTLLKLHSPALLLAEANRKHVKACVGHAAKNFGYRTTVFIPIHSDGARGDVNWILSHQSGVTHANAVGAVRANAVAASSATRSAKCTWSNGCCTRHPRLEVCVHTSRHGSPVLRTASHSYT